MPKYNLIYYATASKCVEVEAANLEEAAKLAEENQPWLSLCHQCSHEVELGDIYNVEVEIAG